MLNNQRNLVYEYHLDEPSVSQGRFDLSKAATQKRYRFVDTISILADNPIIQVYEYQELPSETYATISYPWRGKKAPPEHKTSTFEVTQSGKVAGDPISITLLQDACRASQQRGANLLWLDRLCVNKSDKIDDAWQTMRMYDIYQGSKFCIVFPFGLWQLSNLDEVTPWIDRGWTLQEAILPARVEVIFQWEHGGSEVEAYRYDQVIFGAPQITVLSPGLSAMAPLSLLLDCTIRGVLKLLGDDVAEGSKSIHKVSIFGTRPETDVKSDFRLVLPNVAALAMILDKKVSSDREAYYYCIWKSTMMRSTRDPQDKIYSIMGLFGESLDPNDYPDKADVVSPSIALAQRILKKQGRATWLGVSLFSPPCYCLSTFPSFPQIFDGATEPKVIIPGEGRVLARELMFNDYVESKFLHMPTGEMDDNGYLSFSAISVPVSKHRPRPSINAPKSPVPSLLALNDVIWYERSPPTPGDDHVEPNAFAVLLGCFLAYSPFETPNFDASNVHGFILIEQPDEPGKFYLDSYFMCSQESSSWIPKWKTHDFCVGGRYGIKQALKPENESRDLTDYIRSRLAKLERHAKLVRGRVVDSVELGPAKTKGYTNGFSWAPEMPMEGHPWQSKGQWTSQEIDDLRRKLEELA